MDEVEGSSGGCPFLRRNSKRSFSTMADSLRPRRNSSDTLFVSQDDHYDEDLTPEQYRRRLPQLALPSNRPTHYAGDGYDFRRPVMSEGGGAGSTTDRTSQVIDLTEEDDDSRDAQYGQLQPAPQTSHSRAQRLPRFDRNIISVESEDEDEPGETANARPNISNLFPELAPRGHNNSSVHHPRYSVLRRPQRASHFADMDDEIEFVEERPRSRRHTISRAHTPALRSVTPYPPGNIGYNHGMIDLTGDEDDEVVHVDTRARPGGGVNQDRPGFAGSTRSVTDRTYAGIADLIETGGNRLMARLGLGTLGMGGAARAQMAALEDITHNAHRHTGTNHARTGGPAVTFGGNLPRAADFGGFMMAAMEYETPAFDMGYGGNQPTAPRYEPPSKAAPGFTRSPKEDEEVVCPNCGDELAMGESEEKQEVYVIKKCGHAYCGDCAKNRNKLPSKSKKGKAPVPAGAPMFKHCVVDGCKESASAKSFLHVFIGS